MGGCVGRVRAAGPEPPPSRSTGGAGGGGGGGGAGTGGGRSAQQQGGAGGALGAGATRKNHPLCHETIRWKSDIPLTEGQLRSKRDEFWDTAPAFDGRREIWDALRAAAAAAELLDFALAQAILDGASVSVPNGYLTECYDEWGARYKLPVYCLSHPVNLVRGGGGTHAGRDSPADCSEPLDSAGSGPGAAGGETALRLRLSTSCRDVKLQVYTTDTIAHCKRKLQKQEGVEPSRQRWFFGGKLLGDKLVIEDAHIQPGYVVQVIINTEDFNDS